MLNRTFWTTLLALTLIVALALPVAGVLAQDDPEPVELEEVDPLAFSGDIAIAGSSTVEPATIEMARLFNEDGFAGSSAMGYAAMVTIPVLITFLLFQKWFVQSVSSSGVKG